MLSRRVVAGLVVSLVAVGAFLPQAAHADNSPPPITLSPLAPTFSADAAAHLADEWRCLGFGDSR